MKKAHELEPNNVVYMIDLGEFFRQDKKVAEAKRCTTTLKCFSRISYIDVIPCLKNNGRRKRLTKILPKIYPNANCKKVQSPLYAIPGILTNVRTEVSVATIENIAVGQDTFFPAKKKSCKDLFLVD